MGVGERIRKLREQKHLSQGDIEDKTGLLRCYISRVENGHTVPSVETLQRFAGALDVPLYMLFYNRDEDDFGPDLDSLQWSLEPVEKADEESRFVVKLKGLQDSLTATDREMLIALAKKLAARAGHPEERRRQSRTQQHSYASSVI